MLKIVNFLEIHGQITFTMKKTKTTNHSICRCSVPKKQLGLIKDIRGIWEPQLYRPSLFLVLPLPEVKIYIKQCDSNFT